MCDCCRELHHELAELQRERTPLIVAAARADLLAEQAISALDAARAACDRALFESKSTTVLAARARAALQRHDQAIQEVRAELAARHSCSEAGAPAG